MLQYSFLQIPSQRFSPTWEKHHWSSQAAHHNTPEKPTTPFLVLHGISQHTPHPLGNLNLKPTTNLFISERRLFIVNNNLLPSAPGLRRIHQQLGMARVLQTHEPECSFIHALAHRQETMILQNAGFPLSQGLRDADPLLPVQNNAAEAVVHGMWFVEAQSVLRDHVQLAAECREGLAVHGVRVAGRVDVGAGFMDCDWEWVSGLASYRCIVQRDWKARWMQKWTG